MVIDVVIALVIERAERAHRPAGDEPALRRDDADVTSPQLVRHDPGTVVMQLDEPVQVELEARPIVRAHQRDARAGLAAKPLAPAELEDRTRGIRQEPEGGVLLGGRDLRVAVSAAEGRRGWIDGRDPRVAVSAAEGRRGWIDGRDPRVAVSAAEGRRGWIDRGIAVRLGFERHD